MRPTRTKARVLALVGVLLNLAEEEGGGGMIADWKHGLYRQPWQELLSSAAANSSCCYTVHIGLKQPPSPLKSFMHGWSDRVITLTGPCPLFLGLTKRENWDKGGGEGRRVELRETKYSTEDANTS